VRLVKKKIYEKVVIPDDLKQKEWRKKKFFFGKKGKKKNGK
jgi:hypothetical protein